MTRKEQVITASYLLASVGLFALAIELWICGSETYCRENNRFVSSVANATVEINVPSSFTDSRGKSWSGRQQPDFSINLEGDSTTVTLPSLPTQADGGADGH